MEKDVYRQLAATLDAIPNGFPATESGVELHLLARIFAPEEAALAAQMRLKFEPAGEIAARTGVEPARARQTLRGMARNGLIRVRRGSGEFLYALMPFVVGIYEEQLPRLDAELAALVEQYFRETKGLTILETPPPIHRVVPVEEAVPHSLEAFPYERAVAMVESAKSWGVRECICRVQKRLIGQKCDHILEACLMLAPIEGVFQGGGVTRPISREEALTILRQTEEDGLVHTTGNYRDGIHYICNCCTCCCAVLQGMVEFEVPNAVASSGFRSVVQVESCVGCGDCVERCPFGALSVPDDVCVVDAARCVGCGLCVPVCPADALFLERLPETDAPLLPDDFAEWARLRAQARGLSA